MMMMMMAMAIEFCLKVPLQNWCTAHFCVETRAKRTRSGHPCSVNLHHGKALQMGDLFHISRGWFQLGVTKWHIQSTIFIDQPGMDFQSSKGIMRGSLGLFGTHFHWWKFFQDVWGYLDPLISGNRRCQKKILCEGSSFIQSSSLSSLRFAGLLCVVYVSLDHFALSFVGIHYINVYWPATSATRDAAPKVLNGKATWLLISLWPRHKCYLQARSRGGWDGQHLLHGQWGWHVDAVLKDCEKRDQSDCDPPLWRSTNFPPASRACRLQQQLHSTRPCFPGGFGLGSATGSMFVDAEM